MTEKDAIQLIHKLQDENKSNSENEKEFNNEWIALIKKSWSDAIDKKYKKKKEEYCKCNIPDANVFENPNYCNSCNKIIKW